MIVQFPFGLSEQVGGGPERPSAAETRVRAWRYSNARTKYSKKEIYLFLRISWEGRRTGLPLKGSGVEVILFFFFPTCLSSSCFADCGPRRCTHLDVMSLLPCPFILYAGKHDSEITCWKGPGLLPGPSWACGLPWALTPVGDSGLSQACAPLVDGGLPQAHAPVVDCGRGADRPWVCSWGHHLDVRGYLRCGVGTVEEVAPQFILLSLILQILGVAWKRTCHSALLSHRLPYAILWSG